MSWLEKHENKLYKEPESNTTYPEYQFFVFFRQVNFYTSPLKPKGLFQTASEVPPFYLGVILPQSSYSSS